MVHHEGVGLVLVSLELILGTQGCYDYHRDPYCQGWEGSRSCHDTRSDHRLDHGGPSSYGSTCEWSTMRVWS